MFCRGSSGYFQSGEGSAGFAQACASGIDGGIYTNNPPDSDFTRNGVHVSGAVPLSFGLADGCTCPCS